MEAKPLPRVFRDHLGPTLEVWTRTEKGMEPIKYVLSAMCGVDNAELIYEAFDRLLDALAEREER